MLASSKEKKTMTVKDLIKKLQQADPDAPVILMLNGTVREVTGTKERLCRQQFSMVSFPVFAVEILANEPEDCRHD